MIIKVVTFFTLLSAAVSFSFGQVKVTTGTSIQELVKSLEGPGVKISNITAYTPFQINSSFGFFQDNTKSIGIGSGLLLTTGAARFAEGPNNTDNRTQVNNSIVEDPDLKKLVGSGVKLYDICLVEFDIVTSEDQLTFNYVFASEEYNEYTDFNDVFGFFISGPGIPIKRNLAVIPGTSTPVSVSNINYFKNSQFFVNNDFVNNRTQYDGFTVPLTASVKVQPCKTYRIKLAIQDTRDQRYDSGVFLEKGSFKSENPPSLEIVYDFPHLNYGVENCNNAKLILKRNPATDLNSELSYPITLSGTAVTGIDYTNLPDNLVLPAGDAQAEYTIEFFQDNLQENIESTTIVIPSVCPNFPPLASVSFIIKDKFDYRIPSSKICPDESIVLNQNPSPGQSFVWEIRNTLSCHTCPSPTATPDTITYYPFTITDDLSQCSYTDSILVDILYLTSEFSSELDPCYTALDIAFKNHSNYSNNYYWDFGDGFSSEEENPRHYYASENISLPHKYTVKLITKSNNPSCIAESSREIEITERVFIPNLLTPNGDSKNDEFKISGIGQECWTLYIFNKWGALVYQKENYMDDFNALHIEDGTYFYHLENGPKDKSFKGWIQIVR